MALTEKQTTFLDSFCDAIEAGVTEGEAFRTAKTIAGYSENTQKRDIISDEVADELRAYGNRRLVMTLPKALKKFDGLIDDPEQGGAPVLLNTLNSLFDRSGLIKKEAKEVTIKAPTGIVVMPGKVELDPEE